MIQGYATSSGTEAFIQNNPSVSKENYRKFLDLNLSNVGVGTYLGDANVTTDELVKNAVKHSILAGVNVIDTAINYRSQKAERSVGKALDELISEGKIQRDQIFISTKNGYVTNDADVPDEFWKYVKKEYVDKGIIQQNDISSGYHCMSIPYLEDQLNRSLKNLNLECIDLMYLHNAVEGQIRDISKEELIKKLEAVFEFFENKRKEGKIKYYGMATWECFRVTKDNPQFLELSEIIEIAKKFGGQNHGFHFIQLPFNMYYDQAYMQKNQRLYGKEATIFDVAQHFGIGVFTSVPFMQGRLLAPGVMPEFGDLKPSLRALQFIRSTPGVLAPLVGHKTDEHVTENLEILKIPPIKENEYIELIKKLTS